MTDDLDDLLERLKLRSGRAEGFSPEELEAARNIRRYEVARANERNAQRDLALKLINIGYKAIVKEKGLAKRGPQDPTAREVKRARDRLKKFA